LCRVIVAKKVLGITVYTVKEVAKELQKSPSTVRRYIYEGHLGAIQIGRDYLIPEKELFEFLRKNANKPNIKF
jgi:excisionase family DNA binding protein